MNKRVLALFWAFTVAATSPLHGQVVRGVLVDAEHGGGISGAMANLVAPDGAVTDQGLTRAPSGTFQLRAPSPGTYRVTVERIGYASAHSDFIALDVGDTVTIRIAAHMEAISLEGVTAETEPRCEVRPEDGLAVARVWNEARKALAAAAWTQDMGMYEYDLLRIKRQFDEKGRKVESESRTRARTVAATPYGAVSADSLVSHGFAHFTAEASNFWAPDAEVLLSDAFLDTHCLRIRRDRVPSTLVALDFEPVPGRGVPDIAGTMWLSAADAHLQWIDYQYVDLGVPPWLMDAEPGGRVEYLALSNGTWVVTSWHIRMFTPGEDIHPLTGRPTATLEGVGIELGEVVAIHDDEGVVVYEGDPGYRVVGSVVDSLGSGLPGARVFVEGSGTEAYTDSLGRYELTHMGAGEYSLRFTHPYLEQFWYRPDETEATIGPREPNPLQVDFHAPSLEVVLSDVCRGLTRPIGPMIKVDTVPPRPGDTTGKAVWPRGILTGRVIDHADLPVDGATLHLLAHAYSIGQLMGVAAVRGDLAAPRTRIQAKTNSAGFFRFCWLPLAVPLEILVVGPGDKVDRRAIERALSLADLMNLDGIHAITLKPDSPYFTLDLTLR